MSNIYESIKVFKIPPKDKHSPPILNSASKRSKDHIVLPYEDASVHMVHVGLIGWENHYK